jgi:hypothetical protein
MMTSVDVRCPKCRVLGLSDDCAERLVHDKAASVSPNDEYELEVTVTFAVPVTSSLALEPQQMAAHMRVLWMSDDIAFAHLMNELAVFDYEVQVRPVFTS